MKSAVLNETNIEILTYNGACCGFSFMALATEEKEKVRELATRHF